MTSAPITDGRSARSQRTRTAVVDALLELLRDGNLRPTAREIAERAGVSLRSVYVHFDDLEDLFLAVAQRQIELIRPLVSVVPATGGLGERAGALVGMRGRIYDRTRPVRRAAELQAPFSEDLAGRLAGVRKQMRADVRRVFAAELDALEPAERRRRLAVIDVLAGSTVWDQMREDEHLSADDAAHAAAGAIVALLEADPT